MKILFSATALLLIFSAFSNKTIDPLPIGSSLPLPELKMQDVSGKMVSMEEAAGPNGLLVIFSCNTCPFVIKSKKRITALSRQTADFHIGMMVVNSNEAYREQEDSYEAMKSFAADNRFSCYYTIDSRSQVADAFGASRTPECFLFDKNRKLVYHGAIDDSPNNPDAVNKKYLSEAMAEMAEGREVTLKETKSIGCGIKRKPRE